MTREQTINWLATNCECWKGGQADKDTLNTFTDAKLKQLKDAGERSLAANTAIVQIAKDLKLPGDLPVANMPASIKEKMGGTPPPEEEEEDEEGEITIKTNKGTKTPAANGNTLASWMNDPNLPPEVRETVQNGLKRDKQEKIEVIRKLIVHVKDPEARKLAINRLKGKSLDDLKERLALMPVAAAPKAPVDNQDEDDYSAALYPGDGAPATNSSLTADEMDDVLALPTINFKELAAETMAK